MSKLSLLSSARPFLLGLLLLLVSGCTALQRDSPLPAGMSLSVLAGCDRDAPAAWSPDGRHVAFGRSGTVVRTLADGSEARLDPRTPQQLCWLDERRLVIALADGETTRLLLVQPGAESREIGLPGRPVALARAADGTLLAVTTALRRYSFGANLTSRLFRWDGTLPPVERVLDDVSLKPQTVSQWGERLYAQLQPSVAPLGDEIVYARLHDPPAFPPYLELVQRHLGGGPVRELATLPLGGGGALWFDDERLLLGDGRGGTRIFDPWSKTAGEGWPHLSGPIAVAPGGRSLFTAGALLAGSSVVLQLEGVTAAWFAPDGRRLLLRRGRELLLLDGMAAPAAPAPLDPSARERLLRLRLWRSEGLITPEEYRQLTAERRS